MSKKESPATKGLPTEQPLERVQAAMVKLTQIGTAVRDVVRDIEAVNLTLLHKHSLARLDEESGYAPLDAGRRVEEVLQALNSAESLAKDAAKEAREAGKLAEHLHYGVRSLYREVLARCDKERDRRRDEEASRQKPLFDDGLSISVGQNN